MPSKQLNVATRIMLTGRMTLAAAALVAATATPCWSFGFTFGQNVYTEGPFYSYNPPDSRERCRWRQKWTVDSRGRRVLKRVRVCP